MKDILFVDDDAHVLEGLRRMLRTMRREWRMHFVADADGALRCLARQPIDVIVTDVRMPQVDGIDLLEQVRADHPDVARIILSGQTGKHDALRSTGVAHQFLAKPCEPEHLRAVVERTCQLRELLADDALRALVAGLDRLPSVPDLYTRLVAEMNSPDTSLERVAAIIEHDVSMSAKVLQLVNSAFFGLPRQVSSVRQSIVLLGTDVIRGLVLGNLAFEALGNAARGLDIGALWQHSLVVSQVARALATAGAAARGSSDDALQAGLLHDIGRIVIHMVDPAAAVQPATDGTTPDADLDRCTLETRQLGCDHARLGAYLMGLWGLPDPVVEGIACHHAPVIDGADGLAPALAVHVANALVHELLSGTHDPEARLDARILERPGAEQRVQQWRAIAERCLQAA